MRKLFILLILTTSMLAVSQSAKANDSSTNVPEDWKCVKMDEGINMCFDFQSLDTINHRYWLKLEINKRTENIRSITHLEEIDCNRDRTRTLESIVTFKNGQTVTDSGAEDWQNISHDAWLAYSHLVCPQK